MCLIIYSPTQETRITNSEIETAWYINPDGAGIMYAKDKQLYFIKPLWSIAQVKEAMRIVPNDVPMAIHFRYATHGGKNTASTHPFSLCGGTVGLMHNGILPTEDAFSGSDTLYWVKTVFFGRKREFVMGSLFRKHIQEMIPGNKIFLMDHLGNASILNAHLGIDHPDGRWESNAGLRQTKTFGFKKVYPKQTDFLMDKEGNCKHKWIFYKGMKYCEYCSEFESTNNDDDFDDMDVEWWNKTHGR